MTKNAASMIVKEFESMVGQTMKSIEGAKVGSEAMTFVANNGRRFEFFHGRDCCESVQIEDIIGDVEDLVGSPMLQAEQVSSDGTPAPDDTRIESTYTWTFYRFATVKGTVTVRWLGTSNGYYSEEVEFSDSGAKR